MYQVGDKVIIRSDLIENTAYGNNVFVKEMKEYLGQILTIECITFNNQYRMQHVPSWIWTNEMIVGRINKEQSIKIF